MAERDEMPSGPVMVGADGGAGVGAARAKRARSSASSRPRLGIPPAGPAVDGSGTPAQGRADEAARRGRTTAPAKSLRRKPRRKTPRKPVRWSAKRETAFLEALAESSNVALSLRASGLGETAVYRRRARHAEFAAKWAAALREGYLKLESEMLGRALAGVEKAVWHGGVQVGTVTEYNDRTALALLNAHRATVIGTREPPVTVPIEELRARLKARLGEMNRRLGGEG